MAGRMPKRKAGRKKREAFATYDYESAFQENVEKLNELFLENLVKNRKKSIYALKEVRAGEQLEIEIYPEFSKEEVPKAGRKKKDNSKAQKKLNDKNSRKNVERLLNENFTDCDLWLTLSCAKGREPKDMEDAIRIMNNYIKRVNYRRKKMGLKNARYLYIIEHCPEDKIRWHYHLVMDGEMDMELVEQAWKNGERNRIRKLDKDECGLAGMSMYITKKKRKKGERRWNSSKNLKKYKTKKVHSKRKEEKGSRYVQIGKFIDQFVKDQEEIEHQVKKWFPEYVFTECKVYHNGFNGYFYITARMRKKEEKPYQKKKGTKKNKDPEKMEEIKT